MKFEYFKKLNWKSGAAGACLLGTMLYAYSTGNNSLMDLALVAFAGLSGLVLPRPNIVK